MADTPEFKELQKEFLSTAFGVEYSDDIQVIPEGVSGDFQVKDDVDIDGNYIYQRLLQGDTEIGNNNPKTLDIHKKFIKAAKGKVLVSGLGLGTSLNEILKKSEVESVTVIEKEQGIIDLVSPSFPDSRVNIVCADIFKYTPDHQYDIIYHAIWNTKENVNQDDLNQLLDRFEKHCKKQMAVFYSGKRTGGKRPGAGRKAGPVGDYKPDSEKRTVKKGIRYTEPEYELIRKAAEAAGKSEAFIAQIGAVKEAKEILLKKGLI